MTEYQPEVLEAFECLVAGLYDERSVTCKWVLNLPIGVAGAAVLSIDVDPMLLSDEDRDFLNFVAASIICALGRVTVEDAAARQTVQSTASLGLPGNGNIPARTDDESSGEVQSCAPRHSEAEKLRCPGSGAAGVAVKGSDRSTWRGECPICHYRGKLTYDGTLRTHRQVVTENANRRRIAQKAGHA